MGSWGHGVVGSWVPGMAVGKVIALSRVVVFSRGVFGPID